MKIHLTLTQWVLLLVAWPLCVQLGLLLWLVNLQYESQKALEVSVHSNEIANGLIHLRGDIYRVITLAGGERSSYQGNEDTARQYSVTIQNDYTKLSTLTRVSDPELHRDLEKSRTEAFAALNLLLEIKKSMESNPGDVDGRGILWRGVRLHMTNLLSSDFSRASQEKAAIGQASSERQMNRSKMALLVSQVMIPVTVVTTAISTFFLLRTFTFRISKLSDNAYRLAANRPLTKVIRGSDEIARLDQTFHSMARTVRDSLRKERAVVANARDFICSLDSGLKFTAANYAGERLLAISERELVGQSILNYVVPEQTEAVRKFFQALRGQDQDQDKGDAIETQLVSQGTSSIYALLSAYWSGEEESFFVVVHDVTDRRQAEQLKQEVVVMVTHDLRTPLATLQNILKFLRTGNFGKLDEKGAEYVMVAKRNVERMSNLVNDLLDLEKVKSGLMTLDRQAFELADCFTAAGELAGAFAEEARVQIVVQATDLMVEADQDRVTRVLANLIANGVKFSPQGGRVTVSARQDGKWIYTTVEDQGPGIPADQLESIFERFRQAESAATKGKGGSGLGLTICQAIVELHGGKIWVENLPQGGSRFVFSLPAA